MADIFISYAREDETRIRELVHALEEHGWTIFWDRRIPAGKTWQSYIGEALSGAKCVIVAWSQHSVTSDWVIEEANDAKDRGVLVPILLEFVKPPLGFRGIQAADLTNWKPGDSSPHFDQLIQDIAGVVGGKPHQAPPEKELTQRTQPVATPGVVPTEPPPHEPAPPKLEPLKARLQEPEAIKPESAEVGKKRKNFLIGAMIALALAIIVGWALWTSREPRLSETRPVEPPVTKIPEVVSEAQGVPKSEVTLGKPEALQPKPVAKAPPQPAFTNSIGMNFILIPAGSFIMGSPRDELGRVGNERQHRVTISKPFYLQTTEVTQKQWKQVMGSNPSAFKDCGDDCPVEMVSWDDAQKFIKKLNQMESGAKYRLPTEAEWEYACRAESKSRFCFGDEETKLGEYAWYSGNSFSKTLPEGKKTRPGGKKKPNAWGLYDIHGNVWEWCHDWYGDYPFSSVTDPTGPETGETRVLRGGSWNYIPRDLRSAFRGWSEPGYRGYNIGFRVARDP